MLGRHPRATKLERVKFVCCVAAILLAGAPSSVAAADEDAQIRQKAGVLEKPNRYPSPSVKQPAPAAWFRESHDWGSGNLSGDWLGVRNFLGDHGVALGIRYVPILMGNLTGGLDRGFFGGGPLGVTVTVDTESLIGWKGGTLFVDYEFFNWYNTRYSPSNGYDPTGSYVGSNTNFIQNTDKFLNQVAQLYYRQSFFDEKLSFQFGKMDSNVTFAAVGAAGAFQDSIAMYTSTLNPYFPTYPNEATAISATLAPVASFSFSAALFDGTTAAYDRNTGESASSTGSKGPDSFFDNDGHWFVIAQANAFWEIDPTRPGSLGIGGWVQTGLTTTPVQGSGGVKDVPGVLLQWDQTVWAPSAEFAAEGGGVRFFGQFGWSDPEKNAIEWSLMGGFSATGVVPGRPADALGVMGAYSRYTTNRAVYRSQFRSGAAGPAGGSEGSIEAFYLAQLTSSIYLQPGLLWIRTPGGGNPAPLNDAFTLYLLLGIDL